MITLQKYPFQINSNIINLVADISELSGQISVNSKLTNSPQLRRTNRIKTIYSSLAIEQNTLTIEQVTDVIAGKRILAPPKDIAEVKNAYEIYDCLDSLNPYDVNDLLHAHGVMVRDLVSDAGEFRTKPVGVVDSNGNILHFGTLPAYVPQLVCDLLDWVKNDSLHILIKSCVFHYEFELIHPFSDGNGRIGRLWHTLLLSTWNPMFAWLPIESIIHNKQSEYYEAINKSNNNADSTVFIEFMLGAIKSALLDVTESSSAKTDKASNREKVIKEYLISNKVISNKNVCELFNVSTSTANRILNVMLEKGDIIKFKNGKYWAYKLKR